MQRLAYRYMGAGKACAGHSSARLLAWWKLKPLVVIALANLGGTRPTGSAHVGRRRDLGDQNGQHANAKTPRFT